MSAGPETFRRAVMVRPPADLLEQRRRIGADLSDEVWEGVLHLVPPASSWHQRFGGKLFRVLAPLAEARGLEGLYESGLYRPGSALLDYRVPDLMFVRPEHISKRGVDGAAELVIELLSEDDESREKLGFYQQVGVAEVLLIDPDSRVVELYALRSGQLQPVPPDDRGVLSCKTLGFETRTVDGPKLSLSWPGGSSEI